MAYKDLEKKRKNKREYYEKNKEKIKKASKAFYNKNKEQRKKTSKKWRENNRTKINVISRKWKQTPMGKEHSHRSTVTISDSYLRAKYPNYTPEMLEVVRIIIKIKRKCKEIKQNGN